MQSSVEVAKAMKVLTAGDTTEPSAQRPQLGGNSSVDAPSGDFPCGGRLRVTAAAHAPPPWCRPPYSMMRYPGATT